MKPGISSSVSGGATGEFNLGVGADIRRQCMANHAGMAMPANKKTAALVWAAVFAFSHSMLAPQLAVAGKNVGIAYL
jgi:hypothetical protein